MLLLRQYGHSRRNRIIKGRPEHLLGWIQLQSAQRVNTSYKEQSHGGVYATLGIVLLLALRNPSANRSLIAFTAWSSLVHASIMAVQAFRNVIPRGDLLDAVLPLAIVGALIVIAPAQP
jgi:hypothetical protein